jgi:hypothetical protein
MIHLTEYASDEGVCMATPCPRSAPADKVFGI